jgi:hypothetical protein
MSNLFANAAACGSHMRESAMPAWIKRTGKPVPERS